MTTIAVTRSDGQTLIWTGNTPSIASNQESLLSLEDALTGLLMTREIQGNPEEVAELERARAQAERGEVRWLDDDETEDDERA